jgi:hypothetical protein
MATFVPFEALAEHVFLKKINFSTDTIKVYLTNTAPDAEADAVKADLPTEISGGTGYTTGGMTVTVSSAAQTAGVFKWVLADLTITASGGVVGPFRYACFYSDTATNDELIGYLDNGSAVTLADTQTYTFDFNATNGAYQNDING